MRKTNYAWLNPSPKFDSREINRWILIIRSDELFNPAAQTSKKISHMQIFGSHRPAGLTPV